MVGKPPRVLAIPPNFGAWQQALLPSERALRNGRVVAELPQSIWNSAVVSLGTTLLHKLTTGFFVAFVITSLTLAVMQAHPRGSVMNGAAKSAPAKK